MDFVFIHVQVGNTTRTVHVKLAIIYVPNVQMPLITALLAFQLHTDLMMNNV